MSKILTITADNASNMEKLVELLDTMLSETANRNNIPLIFEGRDGYIRCLAHIINLIVSDIMQAIKCGKKKDSYQILEKLEKKQAVDPMSAIMKLRTLVLYIKESTQRRNDWLNLIVNDQQKRFIEYDVSTRWNSMFRMIDDALRFPNELTVFATNEHLDSLLLNNDDWVQLTLLRNVLEKFDQMTKFLSTSKPQIINALGIYYALGDTLHDIVSKEKPYTNTSDELVAAVKQSIKKYDKYYRLMDASIVYYISSTLDPRSTSVWMEQHLTKIYNCQRNCSKNSR